LNPSQDPTTRPTAQFVSTFSMQSTKGISPNIVSRGPIPVYP
jgi:hypothetical protein